MIITRPNYKQAFLVFAANGIIRLNKKTIGLWTIEFPEKEFSTTNSFRRFKAKVHLTRNKTTTLYDKNKYFLMKKVEENIPDSMLTRVENL